MKLFDRNLLEDKDYRKNIPEEYKEQFYDSDDRVLMGSNFGIGLITYNYIPAKYSLDNKPIYLGFRINYDGEGLKNCPNKSRVRSFNEVKEFFK